MPVKPRVHRQAEPASRVISRPPDDFRLSSADRGYDRRWRKYRASYLHLHPVCVQCLALDDPTPATVVDHIIPHKGNRDLFWESSNHQPLCKTHHDQKTARETFGAIAPVTLVCGPPGSGKTTYVRQHMYPDDLVLDLDALCAALSGCQLHHAPVSILSFACEARDAILRRLESASRVRHAWVIACLPDASDRRAVAARLHASVLVCDVPAAECVARLAADATRPPGSSLEAAVRDWWDAYTPDASATETLLSGQDGALPVSHV